MCIRLEDVIQNTDAFFLKFFLCIFHIGCVLLLHLKIHSSSAMSDMLLIPSSRFFFTTLQFSSPDIQFASFFIFSMALLNF